MPASEKASRPNRWLTPLVALSKSTKLLAALKAAKFLKPMMTLASMSLSVFAYSFLYSWWFSVGLVIMIFVHEMGHVVALKRKGVKASMPVFIPFLGAAVFMPKLPGRSEEAYVGIAGPFIGSVGAVGLLAAAATLPHPPALLGLLAYTALFINLFNLIPLLPLDGGRVTQAVGPAFRYVGFAALLAVTVLLQNPGLLLIWILLLGEVRLGRLRMILGWGLELVMIVMMVRSIGVDQPAWLNAIDIGLATLINGMYTLLDRNKIEETKDQRPHLSGRQRWAWLGGYVVLASTLVVLLVLARNLLPVPAIG